MGIYFEWNFGWYYIILIVVAIWIGLMVYRKDYKLRPQLIVGVLVTAISFIIENIGIYFGLWSYSPGNWPIILWPSYFLTSMALYQIVKLVDEK